MCASAGRYVAEMACRRNEGMGPRGQVVLLSISQVLINVYPSKY